MLDLATDFIIIVVEAQRKIVREFVPYCWPPQIWCPSNLGVHLSEDQIVNISAGMFEEFLLPRLDRLSDHFGGLHLHSCGNFTHQLQNLKKIHHFKSLNFALVQNGKVEQGNDYRTLVEAFAGTETVLVPAIAIQNQPLFSSLCDYATFIIENTPPECKLFLTLCLSEHIRGPLPEDDQKRTIRYLQDTLGIE